MTTSSTLEQVTDPGSTALPTTEPVTVHRRRGALALVGVGAAITALAYLWRAVAGDSGPLGYAAVLVLLPVAAVHVAAWWDARVPLLAADHTGIRLRDGKRWSGLRWDEVSGVSLTPSRLPRRDARLDVTTEGGSGQPLPLAMVDPSDVRALPDLLRALAPAPVAVVVAEPQPEPAPEPEPEPEPDKPTPGPAAKPEARPAGPERWVPRPARVARADVVVESASTGSSVAPAPPPPAPPPPVPPVAAPTRDAVRGSGLEPEQEREPVIGARLVQARRRLRLSVDDLADRTRVRPHVIDAIEAEDFSPCGGDVYARGHLRVLGRVLGIDAESLVEEYDARYSAEPVTARKVFEAELAGPGRSVRSTAGGGPRWSVLIGVVLVLLLVWGLARLLVPGPDGAAGGTSTPPGERSSRSAPPEYGTPAQAAIRFAGMGERVRPTRLRLVGLADVPEATASAGTPVTVRTSDGTVVFQGSIGPGDNERLSVPGAATVITPNAGTVAYAVGNGSMTPLGAVGAPVRRTFAPA